MIISKIRGGLGNQMFQLAAGFSLARSRKTLLKLDLNAYRTESPHQGFELHRIFGLIVPVAIDSDIQSVIGIRASKYILPILDLRRARVLRGKRYILEPGYYYWPEFFDSQADSYISGNWQSEQYFKFFENEIRNIYKFPRFTDDLNIAVEKKLIRLNSISIHVRRGDYVNNQHLNAIHGTCMPDYYHKAIARILGLVPNPYFFIFSDDIEWVKKNIDLPINHECVNFNKFSASFKDMHLMSLCKHHIIANSSFSWWGAWLNKNKEKIVIAPARWFADDRPSPDLIPKEWILI